MTNDTLQKTDVTKAELTLALSKEGLAYQTLLQECTNVVFAKDTLNEERLPLVNLRKVKSKLEAMENPYTKSWQAWNQSRKSLVDPVANLLTEKEAEYRKIAQEIEAENRKIEADKQRKAGILAEIDTFFLNQSQSISAATETSELVRIEKLIGSHKGNSARYQEFLPQMANKAEILAELIRTQKDAIKKIADLRAKEAVAEAKGDDQAVLDLREAQESVTASIEQGKNDVQEAAIKMATEIDVVEPEIIVPIAPKARRSVWTWRIIDIRQVAKKMPDWVAMVIVDEKVDEYLKAKKAEGIEGEEFEFAGIKFYLQKSY